MHRSSTWPARVGAACFVLLLAVIAARAADDPPAAAADLKRGVDQKALADLTARVAELDRAIADLDKSLPGLVDNAKALAPVAARAETDRAFVGAWDAWEKAAAALAAALEADAAPEQLRPLRDAEAAAAKAWKEQRKARYDGLSAATAAAAGASEQLTKLRLERARVEVDRQRRAADAQFRGPLEGLTAAERARVDKAAAERAAADQAARDRSDTATAQYKVIEAEQLRRVGASVAARKAKVEAGQKAHDAALAKLDEARQAKFEALKDAEAAKDPDRRQAAQAAFDAAAAAYEQTKVLEDARLAAVAGQAQAETREIYDQGVAKVRAAQKAQAAVVEEADQTRKASEKAFEDVRADSERVLREASAKGEEAYAKAVAAAAALPAAVARTEDERAREVRKQLDALAEPDRRRDEVEQRYAYLRSQAMPVQDVLEQRAMPELKLNDTPLADALEFYAEVSGAGILADWRSLEEAGLAHDTKVTYAAKGVSAWAALRASVGGLTDVDGVTPVRLSGRGRFLVVSTEAGLKAWEQRLARLKLLRRAGDADLRAVLDRKVPEVKFNGVHFGEALDFLRNAGGAKIEPDWKALEAAGVTKGTVCNARLRDVPLGEALSLVLLDAGAGPDIGLSIDGKTIRIGKLAK